MQFLKDARRHLLETFLATITTKFATKALIGARRMDYTDIGGSQAANQGAIQIYESVGSALQSAVAANGLGQQAVSIMGEHEFGSGIKKVARFS